MFKQQNTHAENTEEVPVTSPSDIPLITRVASSTDHRLVARLCRRAVGPRDYVLEILKQVIADKGLFLACSNGQPIGMVNFEECVDGSGWLGMARTDPDWRRRGVARFLQQQVAVHARKRGIKHLRLWVSSKNRPSLLAAKKGGFRPVCEATHVSRSVRVKRSRRQITTFRLISRKSLKNLLRSPYLSKMNGYFAYKWHFVKASEELLDELVRKGELHTDGESSFIFTKPEMSYGEQYSTFALLRGSTASTLKQVKELAKGYGHLFLGCYLPYDSHLFPIAQKNGFRRDSWGKHCIVFEKKI